MTVFLLTLLFCHVAWAEDGMQTAEPAAVIDAMAGEGSVLIVNPAATRRAEPGAPIWAGEKVVTGAGAAVRIQFPDQSQLVLGKNTGVVFGKTEYHVPFASVKKGVLYGLIPKVGGVSKGPRFLIRAAGTVIAVQRVHGAEFVVEADGGKRSSVHVLDGTLEAARKDGTLLWEEVRSLEGVCVPANR